MSKRPTFEYKDQTAYLAVDPDTNRHTIYNADTDQPIDKDVDVLPPGAVLRVRSFASLPLTPPKR